MKKPKTLKTLGLLFCFLFSLSPLHAYTQLYGELNYDEWQYTYNFCMQNNANACNYLINNGLVSAQDCNANECVIVGTIFANAGRYEEAIEYLQKSCANGDMASCGSVGDIYYFYLQDYYQARGLYEQSCKQKNSASCYALGIMYGNGEGVRQDFEKENGFYKQACNYKEPLGCYNLAVSYYNSKDSNSQKNAKEFFGKACDYGYQNGCDKYRELNEIEAK